MNVFHKLPNCDIPTRRAQMPPKTLMSLCFQPSLSISPAHCTYQGLEHNGNLAQFFSDETIFETSGEVTDNTSAGMTRLSDIQLVYDNVNLAAWKPSNWDSVNLDPNVKSEANTTMLNSPMASSSHPQHLTSRTKITHRDMSEHWIHSPVYEQQQPGVKYALTTPYSDLHLRSFMHNVCLKDIVFGDIIGKGGFGQVHSGHVQGLPVAIKVVYKRRGSGIHREILQAERLAYLLHLRHENIVTILGVNLCDGLRGDALIVMELVSPVTLQAVLDDPTQNLTQADRLRLALQITEALHYLHSNEVVHLDVKPRNVLMTQDLTCKLGDFGSLTRTRPDVPREETEFTQVLGTLPYRAPELMRGCFPSTKADIYSAGITFWQMVTRETPHSGADPHCLIYQVTKVNKRPDYHHTGSDTTEVMYCHLYTACWDGDPDMRPDAKDIISTLSSMLQRL